MLEIDGFKFSAYPDAFIAHALRNRSQPLAPIFGGDFAVHAADGQADILRAGQMQQFCPGIDFLHQIFRQAEGERSHCEVQIALKNVLQIVLSDPAGINGINAFRLIDLNTAVTVARKPQIEHGRVKKLPRRLSAVRG
jgi:hypothetical protein